MNQVVENSGAESYSDLINVKNFTFLIGVLFYFINAESDIRLGLPLAEFALLGLIVWGIVRSHAILNVQSAAICFALAVFLIAWNTLVDLHHSSDAGHAIRVTIRLILFYFIILGYIISPYKKPVFLFAVGFLVGYMGNFVYESFLTIFLGMGGATFGLKYILPTPALVLFVTFFNKQIPTPMKYAFYGFILYTMIAMVFIGSRGAFLSLIVGMIFFGLGNIRLMYTLVIITIALYIPLIPFTIFSVFYDPSSPQNIIEFLFRFDLATLSNTERSLMVYMNITSIMEHPILGIGYEGTIQMVEPYFTDVMEINESTGESPHNYYLEHAVPYGLPPLVAVIALQFFIYRLVFKSIKVMDMNRGIAAYCCTVIAWIMLYQPVASITRLEVFIFLIVALYGISGSREKLQNLPKEA